MQSSLLIEMTDAPASLYSEVNVDIREVSVQYSDGSWMSLKTHKGVYNLLDLRHGVRAVIAEEKHVPAGEVINMRLRIGSNNEVKMLTSDQRYNLMVVGDGTFDLAMKADLYDNTTTTVLVDFDAEESVKLTSAGLVLDPELKIQQICDHDDADDDCCDDPMDDCN